MFMQLVNTKAIQKVKNVYHTVRAPVLLQPIIGFWSSVWCWKLPHADVRRTLSRGKCRDICGHGCADWESRRLRGARCYSFSAGWWDLRLSYRKGKLSRGIMLHDKCTSAYCPAVWVINTIGTSSSILRIVRTWHCRTFPCFQKWRLLSWLGWIIMWLYGKKSVYINWCQGTTSALMSKATMWKSRQRYLPKLVYSVSLLLLKNTLVWWNVLNFMGGPRKSEVDPKSLQLRYQLNYYSTKTSVRLENMRPSRSTHSTCHSHPSLFT